MDLSNVCRDRGLDAGGAPAAWQRFVEVMLAWRRQAGEIPRGVAIADESLRPLLHASDRAALKAAERDGIVQSVRGSADRTILELAERHGASVLSGDRFRGHRDRHSWIQGCTDRFFGWEPGADGELSIVAIDMGRSSPSSLSRHAEADELRGRGLDARRVSDRELLGHAYRCTNAACMTARLYPERLLVPLALRGGEAHCPSCGAPLVDLGPRPDTIKVVLERRGGKKLLDRIIEEGQELDLGRADIRPELCADYPRLARVSRRHVRLVLREGHLWAHDLGSSNGTKLIRWDERRREYAPPIALGDKPQALGRRDRLVLAGALRLRRSGERFAIAPPEAPRDPRNTIGRTTAGDEVEPR